MGADCVIFFQEIESNLRSTEVQFGMNAFSKIGKFIENSVSDTCLFRIPFPGKFPS